MPVAPSTTADLLNLIRKSGIVPPDRLASVDPAELPSDPHKAAGVLIRKGVVTRFQAQQLLQGRHKGFRLGPHVILDQLGRGGMGAVYLAEHLDLHRKVAVKVLVVGKDDDAKLAAERFLREARAAAALDHPNIVRIFDVSRHNDVSYLVMEYVDGETLQQTLDRDGSIPHTAAADAIAQAAAGLQHAYEKGFIHRDIKPGNLIRERSGAVKILDMGLARAVANAADRLTERLDAGAVVGTADFIAPEQAMNDLPIDVRADIYSLGATFFALITGTPPFQGTTAQKLLQHQIKSAPHLSSVDTTLPNGMAAVVAKMLAKKPEDRFQTPAEIIAALAPWLENSTRVLAGLSRTNLALGAELHEKLNDRGGGSSRRMGRLRTEEAVPDTAEVDPSAASVETGEVASSPTDRAPSSVRTDPVLTPPRTGGRKKTLVLAGIGLVLAAAAVAGVIAFGIGKSPESPADLAKARESQATTPPGLNSDVTPNSTPAIGTPQPTIPFPKKDPPTASVAIYRLDLSEQKPFRKHGGFEPTGQQGRDVRFVQVDKTGIGDLPQGWHGTPWDKDSQAEFWAESRGSRTVLGMRNLAKRSAMLVSPDFQLPTARCRIRFEYMTDGTADWTGLLKFKSPDRPKQTGLLELLPFPGTGGAWRVVETDADLRGLTEGFFEIHMLDGDPTHGLYLTSFEVAEYRGGPEPVAYQLDLSGQKPFTIRSGLEMKPDQQWVYQPLARTGSGEPPIGWNARCWDSRTQMEFSADPTDGGPALAIRNVEGPGSAMLFTPQFECQSGVCRLRIEYSATVGQGMFNVRFKSVGNTPVWDVGKPTTGGTGWRTVEYVVSSRGAAGGGFEFHNNDGTSDGVVRIRAAAVTVAPAGTPPPTATTSTAAPNLDKWKDKATIFKLEMTGIAPFRIQKEGEKLLGGDAEVLPPGLYVHCWKPTATSEFRCEDVESVRALGVTNLSDEKSGQIVFDLEDKLRVNLTPGTTYRVKVDYLTRNEATGHLALLNPQFTAEVSSDLPNTDGKWGTKSMTFVRQDVPLRLMLDNSSVGEGNTLFIRSIEVIELEK